ncbi:ankyrin repeat domain-containing protein [Segatella maculosa]|uniref:ankyrin repeat domain-containing protein n=1 Tax=Segatella maculosa TaxID=439703 RepID=UPI0024919D47|nr:ankyrin repeat domain-containing protein [Segatella maculosa]
MFNSEAPYKRFFSEKEYPIIEAIHNQDKDKILEMMRQGWKVNSMGKHGMSYLLYAIWEDNYRMTEFLLEHGADPNFVSEYWEVSPNGAVPMLPLERVCYDKYGMNYMKLLLKHGANPNDTRAQLPLFAAALNNDKRKIEYLLEHGADINQFSSSKETIITDQSIAGKWEMVLWLWDKGADPMKTGGIGVFKGEANVAFWVQSRIDEGNDENKGIKEVIARLKSIGVKFPYKPAQDSAEVKE